MQCKSTADVCQQRLELLHGWDPEGLFRSVELSHAVLTTRRGGGCMLVGACGARPASSTEKLSTATVRPGKRVQEELSTPIKVTLKPWRDFSTQAAKWVAKVGALAAVVALLS